MICISVFANVKHYCHDIACFHVSIKMKSLNFYENARLLIQLLKNDKKVFELVHMNTAFDAKKHPNLAKFS